MLYLTAISLLSAVVGSHFSLFSGEPPGAASTQQYSGGKWFSKKGNVEMVIVPKGDFTMGCDKVVDDFNPQRRIYLDAFLIGKNDVTVAQFKSYCEATGYKFDWKGLKLSWMDREDTPMTNVTWQEARDFCRWAGGDLPTEAQCEKAARGTDGRDYPWGNGFDSSRLLFAPTPQEMLKGALLKNPVPVGSFPSGASPYGCFDMAGNVFQWCLDWYSENYSGQPYRNPTGPSAGKYHVLRGGCAQSIHPDANAPYSSFLCFSRYHEGRFLGFRRPSPIGPYRSFLWGFRLLIRI